MLILFTATLFEFNTFIWHISKNKRNVQDNVRNKIKKHVNVRP